jgi:hypothetical protein
MGFKCIKTYIIRLFFKKIFETYIKDQQTQHCIRTSGSSVTECLQTHQSLKRRIKEINHGQEQIPYAMYMFSHEYP